MQSKFNGKLCIHEHIFPLQRILFHFVVNEKGTKKPLESLGYYNGDVAFDVNKIDNLDILCADL